MQRAKCDTLTYLHTDQPSLRISIKLIKMAAFKPCSTFQISHLRGEGVVTSAVDFFLRDPLPPLPSRLCRSSSAAAPPPEWRDRCSILRIFRGPLRIS